MILYWQEIPLSKRSQFCPEEDCERVDDPFFDLEFVDWCKTYMPDAEVVTARHDETVTGKWKIWEMTQNHWIEASASYLYLDITDEHAVLFKLTWL